MKKEYTVMKVTAIILVVIGHIIIFFSEVGGVITMTPVPSLDAIMRFIYCFLMPLFMFVSGAIYQKGISAGKYKIPGKFIVKKAKRLLIPYLFWGIFWVMPVMLLIGLTEKSPIEYIIDGILLCRDSRHLWFIWALLFVSVIIHFLHRFVERRKGYALLFFMLFLTLWYFSWDMITIFGVHSIMRYLLWYYMGYLFNKRIDWIEDILNRKNWIAVVAAGLSILVIIVYLCIGNNLWIGLIAAGAGIIMIYSLSWILGNFICDNRIYYLLKRNSFGIYLIHPMIIYLCFYCFKNYIKNPYIASVIILVFTLIASGIITEMVRKLNLGFSLGENE